jgi:hypothetical protein
MMLTKDKESWYEWMRIYDEEAILYSRIIYL